MLNNKIVTAMDHVRKSYPNVVSVVFISPTVWKYFDENLNAPYLDADKVVYFVLKDAADSLEWNHFPFIYTVK